MRQEIIEALILAGKATPFDLAEHLGHGVDAVYSTLDELRGEGIVRVALFESENDIDDDDEEAHLADRNGCEPEHFVNWSYCGGPISKAFAA